MICRIADFNIEFKNLSQFASKRFLPFKSDSSPMVSFSVSKKEIATHKKLISNIHNENVLEFTLFQNKVSEWLPLNNTIYLHAALIDIEGTGVAFAALSGTGKTTHILLWQKLLGDKLIIVNGDRPFIRFFENEKYPYGYGTPWCGKENFGTTGRVPLKHLCFIERGEKNTCIPLKPSEVLEDILKQAYIPRNDPQAAFNAVTLINKMLNTCNLWKITCNMDLEAAEVAYNTIFKEQNNEA